MVIKEALACNLPIVSVDVGDVAELIAGIPGCAIVPRDVASLAGGLAAALALGNRTAGRAAIEHLSLDAIAVRLVALYSEVIADAPRHDRINVAKYG
jgi:teichuronic acid biosynthesis glycosyltransferase TuaC